MRHLDSLIIGAFQTSKSEKKSDAVEEVQKLSIKQGITASKADILARIVAVLEFLSISRVSVDNKMLASSSLKMSRGSNRKSKTVGEMDKFDEGRQNNTVPVVSHRACTDLNELSDRPYLKITSAVLNGENFSTSLAHLLTEEVCTIFFETAGLKKDGSSRLDKLLQTFPKFFDSKLRIVLLFRAPALAVMEPFAKYVEQEFGTVGLVRSITSDSPGSRKKFKFDSNVDDEEPEKLKLKQKAQELEERCVQLDKELKYQNGKHENVLEKMGAMNNQNSVLNKKVEELEASLKEKETELKVSENSRDDSSTDVQEVKDMNCKLEAEIKKWKAESVTKDGELQELKGTIRLKNVELVKAIAESDEKGDKIVRLEHALEEKLKEFEEAKKDSGFEHKNKDSKDLKKIIQEIRNLAESKKISLKEALYRKVKNLKLKIFHIQENEESFTCEIEHEKGFESFSMERIKVSGSGKSKKLALNAAIESLLINYENLVG